MREMEIIADLQIHSKYSRAVSNKMDLFEIARCASKKGIQLVATGDWTHPVWFEHIKQELTEASPGIFVLKNPPQDIKNPVYFLLSTEISSIYSQDGAVRRIHNLVFSPSVDVCTAIIKALMGRGAKLGSDGRPIVGISSRGLLELCLEASSDTMLIPAHAWTPWFGMYGSKSGFDSIAQCFGDLEQYVHAIETGLSSDPAMNWQIAELDNRAIVSFSDAHSGPKLGREATVFVSSALSSKDPDHASGDVGSVIKDSTARLTPAWNDNDKVSFSYADIVGAIKQDKKSKLRLGYTIEFFPEEGKYHWSGHREHNIRFSPAEIKKQGTICPVCKRPLTIGVENRVLDVAHRSISAEQLVHIQNERGVTFVHDKAKKRVPFVSAIPLLEILNEIHHSPTKALREYERLVEHTAEFSLLLEKSYTEVEHLGGTRLCEAIQLVRERKVVVEPGYDGVFGTIKLFDSPKQEQATLF